MTWSKSHCISFVEDGSIDVSKMRDCRMVDCQGDFHVICLRLPFVNHNSCRALWQ